MKLIEWMEDNDATLRIADIYSKATELLAEEREEFETMHMMGQSEWHPKADESAAVLCYTQTYGGGDE